MNPRREHPLTSEFADATAFDWRDDGVLWLINATVFHPRGFALGMKADGTDPVLLGDGTEPITYHPTDPPSIDERFAAVEALFARARGTQP